MYGPFVAAGFRDDSCMATAMAIRIPCRVIFMLIPTVAMVDAADTCSPLSRTPANTPPTTGFGAGAGAGMFTGRQLWSATVRGATGTTVWALLTAGNEYCPIPINRAATAETIPVLAQLDVARGRARRFAGAASARRSVATSPT